MVNSKKVFSAIFGILAVLSYGGFFYFKSQVGKEEEDSGMKPETKANICFYGFLLFIALATGMGISYKGKSNLSHQDYINIIISVLAVIWLLINKLGAESALGKLDIGVIGLIGLLSGESLVTENF